MPLEDAVNQANETLEALNQSSTMLSSILGNAVGTPGSPPQWVPGTITSYPYPLTHQMTSTGSTFGNLSTTGLNAPPLIPNSDAISLLPDGRVLVSFSFGKCAITRDQLKDILALLEMGALDKLVGGADGEDAK